MDDYSVATVATNWWINKMKMRCQQLSPSKVIENGTHLVVIDSSLNADLFRFREILFKQILFHVTNGLSLSLTCCYLPNRELSKLANKASIDKTYFPIHAQMQIYGLSVEVSCDDDDLHKLPMST